MIALYQISISFLDEFTIYNSGFCEYRRNVTAIIDCSYIYPMLVVIPGYEGDSIGRDHFHTCYIRDIAFNKQSIAYRIGIYVQIIVSINIANATVVNR